MSLQVATELIIEQQNDTATQLANMNLRELRKMILVYNALNDGWKVAKRDNSYVFTKKHEGRQEVMDDKYVSEFLMQNLQIRLASPVSMDENSFEDTS